MDDGLSKCEHGRYFLLCSERPCEMRDNWSKSFTAAMRAATVTLEQAAKAMNDLSKAWGQKYGPR